MADVRIRRVLVSVPASASGTQDITISGFGTPKGAILFLANAATAGTARADAAIAIGVTDGTTHKQASIRSVDALATTKGISWIGSGSGSGGRIIGQIAAGAGSHDALATFTSWITDGIRISWSTSPTEAMLLEVILIGGAAVSNVGVGQVTLSTTSVQTSVGFQPTVIFAYGIGRVDESPTAGEGQLSVGWYADGTQGSVCWAEDSATTAASNAVVSTTYGLQSIDPAAGTRTYGVTLGTYASGVTSIASATPGTDVMQFLAIKFNTTVPAAVFTEQLPATSGSYSKTGLTFKPGFGMAIGGCVNTALNTVDPTDSDGISIGVFDEFGACTLTHAMSDGSTDSDTLTFVGTSHCHRESGVATGAISHYNYSTFTSFNSDGWTMGLTQSAGLTHRRISFAIEANTVVDLSGINATTQAQTLDSPSLTQHNLLAPASLTQAQTISSPSLVQHSLLAPAAMSQLQTISLPALLQHSILAPDALAQAQTMDLPTIAQTYYVLSPNGMTHLQTMEVPALVQHSVLAPEALTQLQTLSESELLHHAVLTIDILSQLQTLTEPTLVQQSILTVTDMAQLQTFDEPEMTVFSDLKGALLSQGQTSDFVLLVEHSILVVQDMAQTHGYDEPVLTQHHLLAPTSLVHPQVFDAPSLVGHLLLDIHALTHVQTSDLPALVQHGILIPDTMTQALVLAEPVLTQHGKVFPLSLTHTHFYDSPSLKPSLIVQGMGQAQSLDLPSLAQHHLLSVDSLSHLQDLSLPDLFMYFRVFPDAMTHVQLTNNMILTLIIKAKLEGLLSAYALFDGTLAARASLEAELSATASFFGALKPLPVQ